MADSLPPTPARVGPPDYSVTRSEESWPPNWIAYPAPPPATSRAVEVFKVVALGAVGLLLVTIALGILAALFLMVSTLLQTTEAVGSLGGRLDRSLAGVAGSLGEAGARVADLTDPTRPPRAGLVIDTEIASFRKVAPGETIGEANGYRYVLREIRLRDTAAPAEHRQFAVIHRERTAPPGRSLLGIPLPPDTEEADYFLDRGELYQIGSTLFKVNWISAAQQELGLVTLRYPDQAAGSIEFRSGPAGRAN